MTCNECGIEQALARSWYECSPVSGKPAKDGGGWCGACFETLHARHQRDVYRRRDVAEEIAQGDFTHDPVRRVF